MLYLVRMILIFIAFVLIIMSVGTAVGAKVQEERSAAFWLAVFSLIPTGLAYMIYLTI